MCSAYESYGNFLRDQGRVEEASALYERALRAGVDYAAFSYGDMLTDAGRYEEAEAAYSRAYHLIGTQNRLAKLYLCMGDVHRADRAWRSGIGEGDSDAVLEYGWYLFQTGRQDQGLRLLEDASDAGNVDAHRVLGAAYAKLGRVREAERQFRLAIEG